VTKKPSPAYGRMFSAFFFGGFLVVAGAIGLEVRGMSGAFRGWRWVEGPIWPEIAMGSAVLLLGVYFSRRLPGAIWERDRQASRPVVKDAGSGKSAGARRSLNP
jgi:hypothetical protein